MTPLTNEQKANRAYRALERAAARDIREGRTVECISLQDGTVVRVGDVVEWYRVRYFGPADGLVTVTAVSAKGFLQVAYEREKVFGGTEPADRLLDAAFVRAPRKAEVVS
jgi:hypothetical protein